MKGGNKSGFAALDPDAMLEDLEADEEREEKPRDDPAKLIGSIQSKLDRLSALVGADAMDDDDMDEMDEGDF